MTMDDTGLDFLDLGDFDQEEPGKTSAEKFEAMFKEAFPNPAVYAQSFRLPLACLAISPDPVPAEDLIYIFSWVDDRLESFAREVFFIADMVMDRTGRTAFAIRDPEVSAWLFSPAAGPYMADEREAAQRMADAFFEIFDLKRRELTPYEALTLPFLLKKIPTAAAREKLAFLSDTPAFVSALMICGEDARVTGHTDQTARFYLQALEIASALTARKKTSGNAAISIEVMRKTARIYLDTDRIRDALAIYLSACRLATSEMEGKLTDSVSISLEEDLQALFEQCEDKGDLESADACYVGLLALARNLAFGSQIDAVQYAGLLTGHAHFLMKHSMFRERARDDLLLARRILLAAGGHQGMLMSIERMLASLDE